MHVEQLLQNTFWMLAEDPGDFQKGKSIPRAEDKDKKRDKGFQDQDLCHRGGSCEGGRETFSQAESRRSFGTSEGNTATGAGKAKWREFPTETVTKQHSSGKKWLTCPQQWVQAQRSGFRGQTPGKGLALAVMKVFWGELVKHNWGSTEKSLGPPERQETIAVGML